MTPLQKLPKHVRDFGKLISAKGFKNMPKVQKIAQSGHTGSNDYSCFEIRKIEKYHRDFQIQPESMFISFLLTDTKMPTCDLYRPMDRQLHSGG